MISSLRNDNKLLRTRLKDLENEYDSMFRSKNSQIDILNEAIKWYQASECSKRDKLKSMSEVRTSRVEYRATHESLLPWSTNYTSRNYAPSPALDSITENRNSNLKGIDKQLKRRMKKINEYIKDLEIKFTKQNNSENLSMLSFLNDNDEDDNDNNPSEGNRSDSDSDLIDLDSRIRKTEPSEKERKDSKQSNSNSK